MLKRLVDLKRVVVIVAAGTDLTSFFFFFFFPRPPLAVKCMKGILYLCTYSQSRAKRQNVCFRRLPASILVRRRRRRSESCHFRNPTGFSFLFLFLFYIF